jgi:uncharacterized SAM-binding protein YcdF (DUF218 family)
MIPMAFWVLPLNALFDSLCTGGPPREADVIFVFAGRQERKPYGVALWRRGFAPTLVLSVARFEWRRFVELGLPEDGGLVDLVQRTPPEDRHFFVVLEGAGARAFRVDTRGLGTWNEARALAEFLERERIRSVLVVSSASHLRRAVTTLRALTRGGVRIDATAVPEQESSIARDGWWRAPRPRSTVLWEAAKLLLYRARLGLMALSGR